MNPQFPLSNLERWNIVLASGSPRRRELLAGLGLKFEIATGIDVDETYPATLPPEQVPEYLANLKADAYLPTLRPDQLLITADTVVISHNRVLGKPATPQQAVEMIKQLSGHTHTVVTGVTVATRQRRESLSASTEVTFANLSDNEINWYVHTYAPLDKAGAYGIQEWIGFAGITAINGSYFNVMGLPVQRLYTLLKTF